MRIAATFIAFFAIMASPSAETGRVTKAAWQWTDEERLAERFHPGAAALRAALMQECASAPEECSKSFLVDGKQNPELLLPAELMQHLMYAYDPIRKAAYREKWAPRLAALGLGDEFWERLHAVIQPYIDAELQKLAALDQLRTATKDEGAKIKSAMPSQASLCSRRIEALNAARGAIGRETIEQFLYVVIAPDVRTSIDSHEGAEGAKRYIRSLESGCR